MLDLISKPDVWIDSGWDGYEPLMVALYALAAILKTSELQKQEITEWQCYKINQPATIFSKSLNDVTINYDLYKIVQPLSEGYFPKRFCLCIDYEKEHVKSKGVYPSGELGITWALIGQAFLQYYETIFDEIKTVCGSKKWHLWANQTLKFAHQVRCALAHRGVVHINVTDNNKDDISRIVSWRGIEWSHNNNGEHIFKWIGVCELIVLMLDTRESIESVKKSK